MLWAKAVPGPVVILGGGLAGLACAHELGSLPYLLVEREDGLGGLCRTDVRDGFRFDRTGHWLHLRDPETRALVERLLPGGLVTIERKAAVYAQGTFLPFPYQTSFGALPDKQVVAENLLGIVDALVGPGGAALRAREPATFEEFILRHLGAGIAKHFMVPYNEKLWTVHPRELVPAWTQRFVPRPSLEQVVRGVVGLPTEPAGYNATFLYPREGGIEALPRALAATLEPSAIRLSVEPRAIDVARQVVELSDGSAVAYAGLVSTIPLPELVRLCGDAAPPEVREAASRLRATTVTYVNVGARASGPAYHWVYFAERAFPFYRAGSASAAWAPLAPDGLRSFYVEYSHRGGLDRRQAERDAVAGLVGAGLVARAQDVLFAEAHDIPGAYVIYDADHGPAKEAILAWAARAGIETCGRYGRWEYSSMEDAMIGGRAAARALRGKLG